jgi:hypothetical protein
MPDWVADKQARLAKIHRAKAELEAEAKAKAAAEQPRVRRLTRSHRANLRRRQHKNRKRSATSPIPKAASSSPRTATSRATMHKPRSTLTRRSSWPTRSATMAAIRASSLRCSMLQDQSGQQSARSIGRCRLLLDRQSSHAEPATDQRLHRNRTTKARQQVRYREAAGQTRLASRQDDQPAQSRRPSQPLPLALRRNLPQRRK